MAFALVSLTQVLKQVLLSDEDLLHFDKQELESLQQKVTAILTFLKDYSSSSNQQIYHLETRITDAAYQAEDIVETHLSSLSLSRTNMEVNVGELQKVLQQFDSILQEFHEIKNNNSVPTAAETEVIPVPDISASLSALDLNESETAIEFDDFKAIKDKMRRNIKRFEIIPIYGMGGIGKSTLARKLYEQETRGSHFDRCAWIVVSEEYSRTDILLGFLQSLTGETEKQYQKSDSELMVAIHKEQFGRRCLIVVDDLWSTEAWDDLGRVFSRQANGSRVLLTTRQAHVATYVASTCSSSLPYEMHFLSANQSLKLLNERVFGKERALPELEQIGRKIAIICCGLPLMVVVVAGLLKDDTRGEYWESISQNISSGELSIADRCSKVLTLSYDRLPLHLKPCFLHVTSFPKDAEINANRIIRLWVAEGFVDAEPSGKQCVEEVAEVYLNDLAARSLLVISRKRYDDRIKAVGIHDLLRDLGTLKCQEDRFSFHGHKGSCKPRRLSIHTNESLRRLDEIDCQTTRSLLISLAKKRESILNLMWPRKQKSTESAAEEETSMPNSVPEFLLLRIFDAPAANLIISPEKSIHLRYLAFDYDKHDLPRSWFKLRKLESLIIRGNYNFYDTPIFVPVEIWKLPSLRHVILPEMSYLEQPESESSLHTLSAPLGFEITSQITDMLVNLRKLGLRYDGANRKKLVKSLFDNVVNFEKLEAFKLIFGLDLGCPTISLITSVQYAFPPSLKRLTLVNTYGLWEDMSIVGSLPNLEVLKLRYMVARDTEWNPIEGEFENLKYLELKSVPLAVWEAESCHFPSLEILKIMFVFCLEEIPSGIGESDTLKLIQVSGGKKSLKNSARKIQAEQLENSNESLQVIVAD